MSNITIEQVIPILLDRDKTNSIVFAAARALNILDSAVDGKTPDGDDAAMSARTALRAAFLDLSELEVS
jgi:hypothetical protein